MCFLFLFLPSALATCLELEEREVLDLDSTEDLEETLLRSAGGTL